MGENKKVLIAVPQETTRKGLVAIFVEEVNESNVYAVATREELLIQAKHCFDLIVIDEFSFRRDFRSVLGRFVVLSDNLDWEKYSSARHNEALAYLSRDAAPSLLKQTLYLEPGAFLMDPAVTAWMTGYTTGHLFLWLDISALTEREREVIHFCWEGMDIDEVAKLLHIEESTIRSHLSRAYGKLRLNHYQAKAIMEAFKHREKES